MTNSYWKRDEDPPDDLSELDESADRGYDYYYADDVEVTTDAGALPLVLCARYGDVKELLADLTGQSLRQVSLDADDEFPSLYDNIPHLFVTGDEDNTSPLRAALEKHLLEHGVERILIIQ